MLLQPFEGGGKESPHIPLRENRIAVNSPLARCLQHPFWHNHLAHNHTSLFRAFVQLCDPTEAEPFCDPLADRRTVDDGAYLLLVDTTLARDFNLLSACESASQFGANLLRPVVTICHAEIIARENYRVNIFLCLTNILAWDYGLSTGDDMPTAHEVATELRKFADTLDTDPDVEIAKTNVWWYFWSDSDKEMFKRIARLLPRPLVKSIDDPTSDHPRIVVKSASNAAVEFEVRIPQRVTCRVVEPARPAVYECEPILSENEEAEITA